MSAIRQPGKVNQNTTLIDIEMGGVAGTGAVYLIESTRNCLIDSGTRAEAPRTIKSLKALGAWPPDKAILTHPHHDYVQGAPIMRREATKRGGTIDVMASPEAISARQPSLWRDHRSQTR